MVTTHLYLIQNFNNAEELIERYCKLCAHTCVALQVHVNSSAISSIFGYINAQVITEGEGDSPAALLR
jgi:hypothetical protein